MLNGIEVLNSSYLLNGNEYANLNRCVGILILSLIIIVIGVLILSVNEKIGVGILAIGMIALFINLCYSNEPSDIKQYQVTISDSVSMVEFNEKYDVIKVEGKIYTIREKE